jgi:hypothetical protein
MPIQYEEHILLQEYSCVPQHCLGVLTILSAFAFSHTFANLLQQHASSVETRLSGGMKRRNIVVLGLCKCAGPAAISTDEGLFSYDNDRHHKNHQEAFTLLGCYAALHL